MKTLKTLLLTVVVISVSIGCFTESKSPTAKVIPSEIVKEIESNATNINPINQNKDTIAHTKQEIIPFKFKEYENPTNIKELLSLRIGVDTLYTEVIPNDIGDDDNNYRIRFNNIIGIDTTGSSTKSVIKVIDSTSYFNPMFKTNNEYYLPFCMEPGCDIVSILQWTQLENELIFKKNYQIKFLIKYGKLKVSDVKIVNQEKYILVETFSIEESSEFFRTLTIIKDDSSELTVLAKHRDQKPYKGAFRTCCELEVSDTQIEIKNQTDNSTIQKIPIEE